MYSSGMETIKTNKQLIQLLDVLFSFGGWCLSFHSIHGHHLSLKENETNYFAVVEQCGSLRWFILKRF